MQNKIKNSEVQKIWDGQWQSFAEKIYLKINEGVQREILAAMEGEVEGKRILEVGAGSGSDVISLAKKGAVCAALDFSKESINVCQKLAKQERVGIKTILADCRQIPIESNYFDFVFSVGLVEHFKDPVQILQEQLRVLKKGGFLIVDVPQKYNLYTIVKHLRMKLDKHPFGWETEYSMGDFKRIAKTLKLKVIRFYGRDTVFRLRLPKIAQDPWLNIFSIIENSKAAPFTCLNIGMVCQK